MKRMAEMCRCAIAGSVSVSDSGKFYNRFYFVYPDGKVVASDKRHLFTYGGESYAYTPGKERIVVTCCGFRFFLLVCYDLRFPVWSRCRKDYDAILYVANWPASWRAVWDVLLRARALENQCYVIGVNRVGADLACRYDRGSIVLDPYGKPLAVCEDGKTSIASACLDKEVLEHFRLHFPVLEDADGYVITR